MRMEKSKQDYADFDMKGVGISPVDIIERKGNLIIAESGIWG